MNPDNPYAEPPKVQTTPMPQSQASSPAPQAIESLIPYRNGQALIAYYLGLFSIFPGLGLPLAIAAIVLGIRGLRKRARQPELKGAVHAWIGIVMGSIGLLINIVIWAAIVIGIYANVMTYQR